MHHGHLTPYCGGMTLIELLIAMLLTAMFMLGLVHYATAANASHQLQDNQSRLQDQARAAFRMLARAVGEAGFHPTPWNASSSPGAATDGSSDAVSSRSDRLVVRAWSDRNCFGNPNPDTGPDGRPAFHLRESSFERSGSGQLTRQCRYGPSAAELTVQVRRQAQVPGVDAFQVLFGLDIDRDGHVERWAPASVSEDLQSVLGIRIGLLLHGEDAVVNPVRRTYRVLGEHVTTPADGRLRQVLEFTLALRGQTG